MARKAKSPDQRILRRGTFYHNRRRPHWSGRHPLRTRNDTNSLSSLTGLHAEVLSVGNNPASDQPPAAVQADSPAKSEAGQCDMMEMTHGAALLRRHWFRGVARFGVGAELCHQFGGPRDWISQVEILDREGEITPSPELARLERVAIRLRELRQCCAKCGTSDDQVSCAGLQGCPMAARRPAVRTKPAGSPSSPWPHPAGSPRAAPVAAALRCSQTSPALRYRPLLAGSRPHDAPPDRRASLDKSRRDRSRSPSRPMSISSAPRL